MFKTLSIRNKLIISVLIGCLIPYLIGSIYIKNNTEKWLYNNTIEHNNVLLHQMAKHVDDNILKNMTSLIDMISKDTRITGVDANINNYLNITSDKDVLSSSKSEEEITAYFKSIIASQDMITFVAYGTETGGYIEYPTFKPTSSYDPRERSWYKDGMLSDDATISEPYMTAVSNDLVVGIVKSVVAEDHKIGVVSLTLSLDSFMTDLNKMKYAKSGYINILSPNNVFINSPLHTGWRLQSVSELNLKLFESIEQYNEKSFEGKIDGVEKVISVYISPYNGWKYISVMNKSEVLEQSSSLTNLLIIIYFVTFLIVLTVVLIISNHITKPIMNITAAINNMSTFDFELYQYNNIDNYINHSDEIGEISRALKSMQSNYIELNSSIDILDNEIQNIDISENNIRMMSLSADNPFVGISNSVNGLLNRVRLSIGEINKQKEHIHFLADHDPLTNLPNRRYFREKFLLELDDDAKGAVLLIDLDNFKSINDTLGHFFGDKVLQHLSQMLRNLTNDHVFISRFGGDEFLILFTYTEDPNALKKFIDQLYTLFKSSFMIDQHEMKIEFSMGISIFPNDSIDIDQLIMNADLALYNVKNKGKGNHAFFDFEMAEHLKYKTEVNAVLKSAIENDGFKMVYQPQVDVKTGNTIGFEALLRLKNNAFAPDEFITIAEENGLIIPIGRIVTQMVIEQIHSWTIMGFEPKPISINFSAGQMHDPNYKDFLINLLKEHNVSYNQIVIEITENIFIENKDSTIAFLNDLRAYGIKIAVDDFGTGFSSLSYLTFLPIDTLKFDRSLCIKFLELENIAVMDSLIALAHSLKLKVVAEGIEELNQVRRLIKGECDIIQGYYFSKPLDVKDAELNYNRIYHTN